MLIILYRDIIYTTDQGAFGFRGLFESLYKETHIHATVLDAWVDYLNHIEEERDVVNSVLRLFLKPEVVSLYSFMILLSFTFLFVHSFGGNKILFIYDCFAM